MDNEMSVGDMFHLFLLFFSPVGFFVLIFWKVLAHRYIKLIDVKPKDVIADQPMVPSMGPYRTPFVPAVQGEVSYCEVCNGPCMGHKKDQADVRVLTLCSRWDFEMALGKGAIEKRSGRDEFRVTHRCTPNCGGVLHDSAGDFMSRCGCDGCNYERQKALDSLIKAMDDNAGYTMVVTDRLNEITEKLGHRPLTILKK